MYKTTRPSTQERLSRWQKIISAILLGSVFMVTYSLWGANKSYAAVIPPGSTGLALIQTSKPPPGSDISVGETIAYTITLQNNSAIPLTDTTVLTDTLYPNPTLSFVSGSVSIATSGGGVAPFNQFFDGETDSQLAPERIPPQQSVTIPAGGEVVYILQGIVASTVNTNTVITNTVVFTSPQLTGTITDTVTHTVKIPAPTLTTTLVAPNDGSAAKGGDIVEYLVEYENSGGAGSGATFIVTIPVSNVTDITVTTVDGPSVSPVSPMVNSDNQITLTLPSLPHGIGSFNINFPVPMNANPPVAQFPLGIGYVTSTITMTVSPTPTGGISATNSELLIQPIAELLVEKTIITDTAVAGSTDMIVSTLAITNSGALTSSVLITETLPFPVTNVWTMITQDNALISMTSTSVEQSVLTFILDNPSLKFTYGFNVPPDVSPGVYQIPTTAFSEQDDTVEIVGSPANFTVINSMAFTMSQHVTASHGITSLSVGDIVTYTIVISNAGPGSIVPGTAIITDAFIMSPTDSTSLYLMNITSTPEIPLALSPGTLLGSTPIILADNFALGAAETLTMTLEFIIGDTIAYPVNITNTVGIAHPDATPSVLITESASITVTNSLPIIERSASADEAEPGDTITYTITISRAGDMTHLSGISETISFREELPDRMTYVGGTAGILYDSVNHQISYSGQISNTAFFQITYVVAVDSEVEPGAILQSATTITTSDRVYESSTTVAVPDLKLLHTLVLVYAGGDNNLDMDRLHNNLEMNADNPNVTTLLVIDGDAEEDALLYRIQHDTDPSCPHNGNYACSFAGSPPLYELDKNVWEWPDNTGSPHNLAGFIKGAIDAYPNHDQVVLVLAGHGNGWAPDVVPAQPRWWDSQPRWWDSQPRWWDSQYIPGGMISDEHPGDALSTYEFSTALDWAYAVTQEKLGLIYMDACSMQMSEVAYEIRHYADYLLGSENTTWASFAYDAHLADIDGTTEPEEIARRWLENEAEVFRTGEYPFTLSIIELEKMEALLAAEDTLAQALIDALEENFAPTRASIKAAFDRTELFESDYNGRIGTPDNYGDLYSFAQQIEDEFDSLAHSNIRNAAQALQLAVQDAVILEDHHNDVPWQYPDQTWSWDTIGGISKYLHFDFENDEPKRRFYNRVHLASAQDGLWDDLIALYWEHVPAPTNAPVCPDDCDSLGKPLPLRPEVAPPNSWTNFNEVPILFDPGDDKAKVRSVEFSLNLGDSCLVLDPTDLDGAGLPDDVKLELPDGFNLVSASYDSTTLIIHIADQEQPYEHLTNARIATLDFDASACQPDTNTELIFKSNSIDTENGPLEEVTASGIIEFPLPTCEGPIVSTTGEISVGTTDEVIRDNADGSVIIDGAWTSSTAISGYYDTNYLHNNSGVGSVRFMAPGTGHYEVFVRWTAHPNRATNAPIDVVHAGGTSPFTKNQRENGGEWISLGMYNFGDDDYVEIGTADTDGYVIADAVRFISASTACPQIRFSPSQNIMGISEQIVVEVYADNMIDLYGVQFEITYDPDIIQVVNANIAPPTNIAAGTFFLPDKTQHNIVDNTAGLIRYTATLEGEKPGVNGDGPIAVITFKAVKSGMSPLNFDITKLSDPYSVGIKHLYGAGEIEVITDTLALKGRVELERRGENNNDGANVCVANLCTVTDEDGFYILRSVPLSGTVVVTHQSYLSATHDYVGEIATVVELPTVELLGGDYNQDSIVNILDGVMVGGHWKLRNGNEGWHAPVDVTDDQVVDVLDLAAVGYNMDQTAGAWDDQVPVAVAARRGNFLEKVARHWDDQEPAALTEFDPNIETLTSISPAIQAQSIDSTVQVDIRVENVNALYGGAFKLQFDPALAQVVDVDRNPENGVQIAIGNFLDLLNHQILINQVNNETGKIDFHVTQSRPAEGKNGSGVLASIYFEIIGEGRNEIKLTDVKLVNDEVRDPQFIPTNTENGVITVERTSFSTYLPVVVR